jgi:putative oligomerization/nucleic acid binding protein
MAYEVRIKHTQSWAKVRSPVWVVVFSFFSLYIYAAFWWYFVNRELRDLGRARDSRELGDSPGLSVLAVTLGALVIVPPIVSTYRGCRRVQAAQRLVGRADVLNGWIALILFVLIGTTLIPFLFAYIQSELNKVWESEEIAERPEAELPAVPALEVPLPPAPMSAGPPVAASQPATSPSEDPLDRLKKLTELRDAGALSQEEFEAQKAKILGGM